jgi:2-amino-4-hydroxy-6-hydroxymethyldihydropteridine diphosphokinase
LNACSQLYSYYLGLGSNVEPEINLRRAVTRLGKACKISGISCVYKSHSEGARGPDFLNAVLNLKSSLEPSDFKKDILHVIEDDLGRIRTIDKNSPRTIDLDILLKDNLVLEPNIWTRVYIAVPLAEFVPELRDEVSGRKLKSIASRIRKQFYIEKISPFPWDEPLEM